MNVRSSLILIAVSFALLGAIPAFAQDSSKSTGSASSAATSDPSDPMVPVYLEALSALEAWGIVDENYVKHMGEPATWIDMVVILSNYIKREYPASWETFNSIPDDRGGYEGFVEGSIERKSLKFAYYLFLLEPNEAGPQIWIKSPTRYECAYSMVRVWYKLAEPYENDMVEFKSGLENQLPGYGIIDGPNYVDVPNDAWARTAIEFGFKKGYLVYEYPDRSFRGKDFVTKNSLALWMYRFIIQTNDLVEKSIIAKPKALEELFK